MATDHDFVDIDDQMDASSTDDLVTEWDANSASSTNIKRYSREVTYWIGRKYFDCVLAQHIASTACASISTTTINV